MLPDITQPTERVAQLASPSASVGGMATPGVAASSTPRPDDGQQINDPNLQIRWEKNTRQGLFFRCVLATLSEGLSVRPSIQPSVRSSVSPSGTPSLSKCETHFKAGIGTCLIDLKESRPHF